MEEQCSPNTRQLTSPTSRRHELHKSTGSHQEEHQTNSTARQQKQHSSPAALHEGQQRNLETREKESQEMFGQLLYCRRDGKPDHEFYITATNHVLTFYCTQRKYFSTEYLNNRVFGSKSLRPRCRIIRSPTRRSNFGKFSQLINFIICCISGEWERGPGGGGGGGRGRGGLRTLW